MKEAQRKMKKKILLSAIISIILVFTSAVPSFAATKLERPEISDISHGSKYISLEWDYVSHADAYKVYRSTSKSSGFKVIDTTYDEEYTDSSVSKGKKYYYKIKAISYSDEYKDSSLSKWRSSKIPKAKAKKKTYTSGSTVYITDTGEKYHNAGCRSLRKSCIPISLSSAKSRGYTACSLCH